MASTVYDSDSESDKLIILHVFQMWTTVMIKCKKNMPVKLTFNQQKNKFWA